MATYGFAIDLRKCIGCHACTIACKAEHQIPIGVNRCWVKTVEKGTFPDTTRLFFPVLCNQCEDAPCVSICPTRALYKRRDGIVDLHGDRCIGCRACMEACPYDQLFIDPNTRTAEKCNFCANRVENQLLPACVSVCPTECRIFGDLDDPDSDLARIVQQESINVRKPEKGTGPRVFYIGADENVLQPEASVRPLYYKEGQVHLRPLGAVMPDEERPGDARVDYDVPHEKPWGTDMVLYLFMKAVATGAMLVAAVLWLLKIGGPLVTRAAPIISIVFIALTALVLIADLKRPERFFYILTRSNWRSWMVWGTWFLTAHGALSALWLFAGWSRPRRRADAAVLAGDPHGCAGNVVHGLSVRARAGAGSLAGAVRGRRPHRAIGCGRISGVAAGDVHWCRTGRRDPADALRDPRLLAGLPSRHPLDREHHRAQPDTASRVRGPNHPSRAIGPALLGVRDCRGRRRSSVAAGRRHVDWRRSDRRCSPARPGRERRVGIHLGRSRAERAAQLITGIEH